MTVAETLLKKVNLLPASRQLEVLNFVEFLEQKEGTASRHDPEGLLADQPTNLDLDDFSTARRDAWSRFPRENPQ